MLLALAVWPRANFDASPVDRHAKFFSGVYPAVAVTIHFANKSS